MTNTHQKIPPNSSKKSCRFFRHAFFHCQIASNEEGGEEDEEQEDPSTDFAIELEVMAWTIRTRAMEAKLRRKRNPSTKIFEFLVASNTENNNINYEGGDDGEIGEEEFVTVGSRFSDCSNNTDDFVSVKTKFSEFRDFRELCYCCEGWPFGLGWKALLLPPLPDSPSESWSWLKGTRFSN